jgi:hypothetical protein
MPPPIPAPLRRAARTWLRPTVRQLAADLSMVDAPEPDLVDQAGDALLRRIGGMAPHLGIGMAGLTLVFDLSCLSAGGRYASLDPDARARMVERWRALPGPLANWALFYEKMGAFSYWSVLEARDGHD